MLNQIVFQLSSNPYVPWDVGQLALGLRLLREQLGIVFNVGVWGFVVISGIYLVIKWAYSLLQ